MKKMIFTGALVMLFSFGAQAQANEDILPQNSRDFIAQHFSQASIAKVEKEDGWLDWDKNEMYEVRFDNGIKLDFDQNGNVTEIDSKQGEDIPMEALPDKIRQYLEESYNGIEVVSWEMDRRDQEVKLADGTELEFDSNGKFLKLD